MYFSLIIPSFRGSTILQKQLPGFIEFLKKKGLDYEILIVDDGSQDSGATKEVAEKLNCRYFELSKNQGKGAAVRKGMQEAKGLFRIFTDVDIPFEFETYERFLYYLDQKEFDVVIGDRTLKDSSYFTEITWLRKMGSKFFSTLVGRFVAGGHFDTQCGIKGFKASVAEDLFGVSKINSFAFDVELLYVSLKRNYDIKRLPVKLRCQDGSTVRVILHGLGMLNDLLKIKRNHIKGVYNKQ